MLLPSSLLPEQFLGWFTQKNWVIYPHQLEMIDFWQRGHSTLLIAPTGAGKTLSGFLPSLIDSNGAIRDGIHTIYISPLKALAVDIARNLEAPIAEMGLDITIETRTGDTPQSRRARIRSQPPHILLTTPESLELMLSWPDAASLFGGVKTIIIDEIHTVLGSKRGDLLSLSLATLRGLAPISQSIGLSATVADPQQLTPLLSAHPDEVVVFAPPLEKVIELSVMTTDDDSLPWAGHSALYAMPRIYDLLRKHKTTLVFVNTRAQAEMVFQALWHLNDDHLKIGIHHGSLDVQQRRRVEAMMADGALDAVVATSSLDLGIDWADIDLVIQVGAPKGVARLIQRVGRAGHRLDAPSRAVLVPANRFEMLEGLAARISVQKRALDRFDLHEGALDILAQHLVGRAVAGPFDADQLYAQIRTAAAYRTLSRDIFDKVLDFSATGGYALDHYSQFHRIVKGIDGLWRLTSKQVATRWRMNIGAIVETATLKVRIKGGPILGEVEEYFVQNLSAGDSFMFGGRILEFIGIRALVVEARSAASSDPKIPAYAGGRLPLSPNLAESVRSILNDDDSLTDLMDEQMKIVEAVKRKDSKGSGKKDDAGDQKFNRSLSHDGATVAKEEMLKEFLTSESAVDGSSDITDPHALSNSLDESKTLAQMVAEANEIDKQSPRKIIIKSSPQSPAKKSIEVKQQSWHGSFMKSLSNIGLLSKSHSKGSEKSSSKEPNGEQITPDEDHKKNTKTPDLPRSDPPILVLARTRFLLAQGEDFLPPYHIVNSNSECIAVWCKTGRWSTLQASVFLHSTAIGNTKSTTAISLAVAATQPWLLGAVIPAGMAAIGTPWIMLKLANDKWNAATIRLTEEFWSWAEPEVFVECIEKWSRLVKTD